MTVHISSTTDTPEAVQAAQGGAPAKEVKTEEAKSAPEAKASEQNESSESETEETEAEESESVESESNADPEAKDAEKDDKPKKKGGFQRRIDKLNARHAQSQQELEYWKQQAMKVASGSKTEAPKVESKPVSSEGKPNAESFETHSEYVEALTDWKVDQKDKAREQKAEKSKFESEQEKLIRTHTERVNAFAAKTEDFQDVLENVDDIPVSPVLREIILQADNGPSLMYELAKNRDEFARICKLAPLAAAREMGKIESRLAASAPAEKSQDPKKISKAPRPISPVGQKGGAAEKSPENMPYQEFKKWREAQLKRK